MLNVRKTYDNSISVVVVILTTLTLWILYVNDSTLMNSDVTSKYFWYYGTTRIIIIVTVILLGLKRNTFHYRQQDFLTVLFIGYVFISGYIPRIQTETQTGLLILLGVTYFIFRNLSTITQRGYTLITVVLIGFGIAEVYIGFRQLYGFTDSNHFMYRLTGSFFNPGPYSGFLVTVLPLALYWVLKKYPAIKQFSFEKRKEILRSPEQTGNYLLFGIAVVYVVGVIPILPAGMSRSAWLAGAAGCFVVLGRHYRIREKFREYNRTHHRQVIIYGIILLLLTGCAGTGMYLMKKDSADGRMLMWKVSVLAIKEHPWTGVGIGKFAGTFGEAQANYFASGKATPQEELVAGNPEYGFNEYLQITVEHGIVGPTLFLQNTYLKEKRYCGDCRSARVGTETGTGYCKNFE